MLREQTPKCLFQVRGKLYELLVNCVPPEVVFKHLALELANSSILRCHSRLYGTAYVEGIPTPSRGSNA